MDELLFQQSEMYKEISFLEHPTNFNLWLDNPSMAMIEERYKQVEKPGIIANIKYAVDSIHDAVIKSSCPTP